MKNSYNICSKMWTDTNINFDRKSLRHCCKQTNMHLPTDDVKKLGKDLFERHPLNVSNRQEMVNENKLPASCKWCIDSEPSSIRHVWNEWSDDFIKQNKPRLVENSYLSYIELDIGSSCDMACVYCGPWSSTTWAKELGQSAKKEIDVEWRTLMLEYLSEYIGTVPATKKLTFNILGGEPLLIVDTYTMIEYIAEHCGRFEKKPILMITTNLNCKPKLLKRLLETIEATKDIFEWQISISIENINERAEAVRYHLNWNNFESNIAAIKDRVERIYLTATISILSFAQLGDFINWAFDTFGEDTYTTSWDFSLNSVQEGLTDVAYCYPDLVDIAAIKSTYMMRVDLCESAAQWRVDQVNGHLDNLYKRLGTKEVNTQFLGFWKTMGERRNLDYMALYPLDQIWQRFIDNADL